MNCKTKWDLNFVEESVGSTFFRNDFKKAQSNTYFEFEKTQLPLIQENIKEFLFNEKKQSIIEKLNNENKKKVVGRYGCFECIGTLYYSDECVNCIEGISGEDEIRRNNICYYLNYYNIHPKMNKINKEFKMNKRMVYPNQKPILKCYCGSILTKSSNDMKPYYKCSSNNNNSHNTHVICKKKYCEICLELLNDDKTHKNGECNPITNKLCPCVDYKCDKCEISLNKFIIQNLRAITFNGNSAAEDAERKKFIMKCQAANCPGFLSTQYKCGVCDLYTCSECLEMKENEKHQCKKENIESAQMIRKETKPCPSCATRIYKIDGCDQMWCVDCKTAFSWNSGQIVNSRIHNPHYYEYLRQTNGSVPREPGDIPGGAAVCGQFPTLTEVRSYLSKLGNTPNIEKSNMLEENILIIRVKNMYTIFTNNVHAFHKFIVELNELVQDDNINIYNKELIHCRVLYSLGRMDVNTFKTKTYMYHQKSNHHNNYIEVMRMFKQICRDMFEYVVEIIKDLKNLNELMISSDSCAVRLVQYTYLLDKNNKLNNILKQWMNSIIYIEKNLTKNKYYTNDCDRAKIIMKMNAFDEEDLDGPLIYETALKKPNILINPYNIKWNKHAYLFDFRYSLV
jgi:hypothetical protein